MINLVCIICPRGCRLSVDENNGNAVSGNLCSRGAVYALSEVTDSKRTITTTVVIDGCECKRCPVKTDKPISKSLMFEAMNEINKVRISAPVKTGDVVLSNVCGTGVNIISTKTM